MKMDYKLKGLEKMARKLKAVTRNDTLSNALTMGAFHIQGWIVKERLTGPRPQFLGRVTSRLATSISVVRGERQGGEIVARIGTNVIYAATHEFGRDSIPDRPFLRPGIEDRTNKEFVMNTLINRIKLAVEGQK